MRSIFRIMGLCLCLSFMGWTFYACQPEITGQPDGKASDAGSTSPDSGSLLDTLQPETSNTEVVKEKDKKPKVNVYEKTKVVKISIELPADEWDKVRKEKRKYDNFLAPKCLENPFGSNFTYRKAKVTVDGQVFKDVGIRKKGFVGSIDENKPSLKLKFDKFVKGQELHELERLTLNNNKSDPAIIRQCLVYGLFAKAGIPAPKCNFAHVTLNGKDYGIFTNVQNVKKRFLGQHFDDKTGTLFEGTLSDFREGFAGTLEPKTNEDKPDRSGIDALIAALKLPDDKFLAAVEKVLDLDKFIKFWAMEVLVAHWDGYAGNTNNFFIYAHPKTKKLEFIPWGVDGTLRDRPNQPPGQPKNVFVKGFLARRLYTYPATQKKFTAQLKKLLEEVWKEDELIKDIERMEKLVDPLAKNGIFQKAYGSRFSTHVGQLKDFVKARRAQLKPNIDKAPAWTGPLPGKFCFKLLHNITGTLGTQYDSLSAQNPFSSGNGTVTGTIEGKPLKALQVGAKSGEVPNQKHLLVFQLFVQLTQADFLIVNFVIHKAEFVVGKPLPIRGPLERGQSSMSIYNVQTKQNRPIGLAWDGTFMISQGVLKKGESIRATFSARWIEYRGQDPSTQCYNNCKRLGGDDAGCRGQVAQFQKCVQGGKKPEQCSSFCGKPNP